MRQFACLLNLVIIRNAPWKVHVRSVRSLLADLEAPAPVSGSVTVCYSCVRFRRTKGPLPIVSWQQRPNWNIDSNGTVCRGTMRVPKSVS